MRTEVIALGSVSAAHSCSVTEEAHAQLDAFVALGGNFIDTAEVRA